MKVALICDTHWGVRGDSIAFIENNKRFLDNVFFPYLDKHKIRVVVHLGDVLDRRKYINYYTASRLRKDFLEPLDERRVTMHWILGNHDIYFRNDNSISAASELVAGFPYVKWYENPIEIDLGACVADRLKVLFVPWISGSNKEQTKKLLETSDARVVMGHLELAGFEMAKGQIHGDGESSDLYRRFELVCSGHYHHSSRIGNIFYLGATGEYTWSDYDDLRGFHIFDTSTVTTEFIPNPYTMFEKVFYDDANPDFTPFKSTNIPDLTGKYVKLIVKSQTDTERFKNLLAQIEMAQPVELSIVQDHLNMDKINFTTDPDVTAHQASDTSKMMMNFVEQCETVNKVKLSNLMLDLYKEAVSHGAE